MPISISGSTGISGVDGSAGNPALVGSDTDTGIFLAAGQVSASVNGTPANLPLVSGTAKAYNWNGLTTNTLIDFENIPSWAKRVTVMFDGVSTNGTSSVRFRLGTSSGVTTSGYLAASSSITTGVGTTASTGGFDLADPGSAASVRRGSLIFCLVGSNAWVVNGGIGYSDSARTSIMFGSVTLSDTLDRIRITTVNGTDTFDAGTINIMYE